MKVLEIVFLFFVKNKSKIYVYLKMDKIIVVLYMNKMGRGGRFLNLIKIVKNIWEFSFGMEIIFILDYLLGLFN